MHNYAARIAIRILIFDNKLFIKEIKLFHMDYFCYISRTKVDQLYRDISPNSSDEYKEIKTTENELTAEGGSDFSIAKIVNIFKAGITYGRKGTIQRERQVKIQYVEKLRDVLFSIAKESPIPSFIDTVLKSSFGSIYYYHKGRFRTESAITGNQKSDSIVTLIADLPPYRLLLDCSLRFFSEGNEPNGNFSIHSANIRFFKSQIDLQMETVFVFLGKNETDLFGTPLFLKLSADAPAYI